MFVCPLSHLTLLYVGGDVEDRNHQHVLIAMTSKTTFNSFPLSLSSALCARSTVSSMRKEIDFIFLQTKASTENRRLVFELHNQLHWECKLKQNKIEWPSNDIIAVWLWLFFLDGALQPRICWGSHFEMNRFLAASTSAYFYIAQLVFVFSLQADRWFASLELTPQLLRIKIKWETRKIFSIIEQSRVIAAKLDGTCNWNLNANCTQRQHTLKVHPERKRQKVSFSLSSSLPPLFAIALCKR